MTVKQTKKHISTCNERLERSIYRERITLEFSDLIANRQAAEKQQKTRGRQNKDNGIKKPLEVILNSHF